MNVITRCPLCRGTKKMVGMGMTERDCERCAGKGTVAVEVKPELIQALKEEEKIVEPIKDDVKHERETETKTVIDSKRKYVRKEKESINGVCDIAG